MKQIFNETRIAEASVAITDALRPHLANESKSTVNVATHDTTAYQSGLNNGELNLAIQRALTVLMAEQTAKLADLIYDTNDEDDDPESELQVPQG